MPLKCKLLQSVQAWIAAVARAINPVSTIEGFGAQAGGAGVQVPEHAVVVVFGAHTHGTELTYHAQQLGLACMQHSNSS